MKQVNSLSARKVEEIEMAYADPNAVVCGSPMVELNGIGFRYEDSPSGLDDITFKACPGERILVLGHNGSGKSTLLSIIGGKRKAQHGSVTVLGRDAFDDTSLNGDVFLIGAPWPPEAYFGSTVYSVCSPAKFPDRRRDIANAIHLPMKRMVDQMSSGEKRRVQILHGFMEPPRVLLLDECSTEIDVAERATVLELAAKECLERGTCCFYATHILDGLAKWATRVIHIEHGKLIRDEPFNLTLAADAERIAHQWLTGFRYTSSDPSSQAPADYQSEIAFPDPIPLPIPDSFAPGFSRTQLAISCQSLSFKELFKDLSFTIPIGSRTLLVGCNGSGKTTLLHMIVGKQFFLNSKDELTMFGRTCYHDTRLNEVFSFGGCWWPKAPGGQVHVREMVPHILDDHASYLRAILKIDLSWDVRKVSAGELKRIQLFLGLLQPKRMIVLDEATADLDLDMRHVLLRYLHNLSTERGVTIIYTTHIFEGLSNWATDCIVLDSTRKGLYAHWRCGTDEISHERITSTLIQLKHEEHFVPNP